ncbi:MAG: hypothetical protein K1X38_16225 [Microthrixaceae bacterium]|nr:hypothetical protein [Microthrixaceae bacterium]
MTAQLILIDTDAPTWKLPEATRAIGRRGIAEARAALRAVPRFVPAEPDVPLGDPSQQHPTAA